MAAVPDRGFQRLAGFTAIVSAVAAIASGALSLAVVPASTRPDYWAPVLALGTGAATTLHFAMVLDVFGYYLLLAPLALFLWTWLGPAKPDLVRVYTIGALAYMLLGALGAVTLGAVLPPFLGESQSARHLSTVLMNLLEADRWMGHPDKNIGPATLTLPRWGQGNFFEANADRADAFLEREAVGALF
jgi:hypothetical protein